MALHMLENVLAFERNIAVFVRDIQKGAHSHFSFLKKFKQENNDVNCKSLQHPVALMQIAFGERFCAFTTEKKHYLSQLNLWTLIYPGCAHVHSQQIVYLF